MQVCFSALQHQLNSGHMVMVCLCFKTLLSVRRNQPSVEIRMGIQIRGLTPNQIITCGLLPHLRRQLSREQDWVCNQLSHVRLCHIHAGGFIVNKARYAISYFM